MKKNYIIVTMHFTFVIDENEKKEKKKKVKYYLKFAIKRKLLQKKIFFLHLCNNFLQFCCNIKCSDFG